MEDVTAEQISSLRQKFFDKVQSENPGFIQKDLNRVKTDDVWMRRFIAHCEEGIDQAVDMLYEACKWRKEFGVHELTHTSVPSHFFEKGVLFIRNKDVFGKPLLVFKAKHHTKGTEDLEQLKKFIVYYFERIERVSKSDQISVIFDMEETGWANMDMDFIRYFITLLKTYYPYFVNYLIIYEMPWLLNAAWKIIKGWLPPRFVDRVKFLNKKTLKEFIDVDNQLAEWGGKDKYTYKFEPEILPAEASADSTPNGHVPNGNATPVVNGQGGKEKLQLSGLEMSTNSTGDDQFKTIQLQTPSPRTFTEPIRRMPAESSSGDGPHLAEVTDRIVLTKDGSDRVTGRFQVRNVALSNEALLFKIKTTAPEKFHVRPTIGFLETSASASITVTVNPGTNVRSLAHERFQVQILVAPKELIDGLNGNHQDMNAAELHSDLSRVWKKLATNEMRIENHRVGCTLDSSITDSLTSSAGASLVTMNEDEMRKGLKQIEQRIVDSIHQDMTNKMTRIERLLYVIIGLVFWLIVMKWWSSPIVAIPDGYCEKP